MERQYNNGDFEKLLRDNANQYRMYPSEKVWKGIHSALHTRRKWYGITAAIMFLITGSIVSIIIYNGSPEKNGTKEDKINTITNNQLASIDKQANQKYTPALNNEKPRSVKPKNVQELIFDNQAFNFLRINEQPNISFNLSAEMNSDELRTVLIPILSETVTDDLTYVDLNLVKFNGEIRPESVQDVAPSPGTAITNQNSLNVDTEDKIRQAVSAIASQNVPVTKTNKHSKITGQVYFTPTVSYRSLSENKRVYNTGGLYVPVIDLNNVVKHKPAMGLEFGIEGRYHVTDNFFIKTGFQFNINRYDIRAYSHPTEIATVALNSGSGFDSLATLSNYRNTSSAGSSSNWLENFYFQAAIPVGVELIISDNKKVQWGVSGTIQPTYVIGDRAYLISSDYKNYARFPDLMRRWNISTGVGTFVSYSTGKVKWQVGPHVRYQHLSSFVSALTVKEKLFAIGLKVGASLNYKR